MPLIVPITDPNNAEKTSEEVAQFFLTLMWKVAEDVGICPICLLAVMEGMVEEAHADGRISHIGNPPGPTEPEEDTMGDPVTSTIQ